MATVTLIGEKQAKKGDRFYYIGTSEDCGDCKLKNVCFNLECGGLYEIVGIRDTVHDCALRESPVKVVEVEKKPFRTSIPKKSAFEGGTITFESRKCQNIGCENYRLCVPSNVKDGEKFTVVDVLEDVKCPIGENLSLVKIL